MKQEKDAALVLVNTFYCFLLCLVLFLFPGLKEVNADELDQLLVKLKSAPDEVSARKFENAVWERWLMSGDKKIDAMIRDAMRRRGSYDFDGALEVLNKVIALKPEYPEAWNQRATVHFHRQEYEKSLEDVAKALELEPRHFGAMAGRGVIRYFQGKPALAVQNIMQAAEYHPYLKELQMFGLPYPATSQKQGTNPDKSD